VFWFLVGAGVLVTAPLFFFSLITAGGCCSGHGAKSLELFFPFASLLRGPACSGTLLLASAAIQFPGYGAVVGLCYRVNDLFALLSAIGLLGLHGLMAYVAFRG
jgi:hypothetical protein